MMWQPIGEWRSPNHHHVVLCNWARMKNIDLGQQGYAGLAFYVCVENGSPVFVVETRGPSLPSFHATHQFKSASDRRVAFKRAMADYERCLRRAA